MMADEDLAPPAIDQGDLVSPEGVQASLGDNLPGQTAMAELLRQHDGKPPRSLLGRIFGSSPLTDDTRVLYNVALGEIEVADALGALASGWVVLHSLPVSSGGSDIDHLVIGPGGVFIIATLNHSKQTVWASQRTLMVGGIRYPDIRNMEYEMGRVERLLSTAANRAVEVSAVLAVVAPKSLTVRQKHRDVEVLAASTLADWLTMRRRVLSPDDVLEIAEAAERSTTWHQGDGPVIDTSDLRARFETLRLDVTRAWRLQLIWAGVISVVAASTFLGVSYVILLSALGLWTPQ